MATMRHFIGATRAGRDRTCEGFSEVSKSQSPVTMTYDASFVLFSSPETMLEQRIQDPTDPE